MNDTPKQDDAPKVLKAKPLILTRSGQLEREQAQQERETTIPNLQGGMYE